MRKRIAKRLWPVPVTLGVMALAALLAFGLMATNGAQPAEAQSDPCITVTAGAEAIASQVPTIPGTPTNADGNPGCDSTTTPATIKLNGQASVEAAAVSNFVIFGPGIGGTAANVYPPGTTYGDHDNDADTAAAFYTGTAGPDAVVVAPLPATRIMVPTGTPGVDGNPVASSMSFDVTGKAPETVTIYVAQGTGFTETVSGTTPPQTGGRNSVMLTTGRIATVNILFLGEPAIGKDGVDFNTDIDDAILEQCVVGTDDTIDDVVAESAGCAADARAGTGDDAWLRSTAASVQDAMESRSKLVVRTGAADATTDFGAVTAIIDGGMKTHTMETGQNTVAIYALVEDGNGKELLDAEVSFRASTMPNGIVATRDLSDDVDTKSVATASATSDDILVDGLSPADGDTVETGAIIIADDAVAAFEFDSLPSAAADSYRIEVVVTVGDLTLGTVVLSKLGSPATIMGDTYNMACLPHPMDNEAGDFEGAKFGKVGQNDCAMADRYGDDQMVVVKAHVVDSLGNTLGDEAANLEAKIGDAALTAVADAADDAAVWIYMINTDAAANPTALGDMTVTISHDDDDDDTTVADLTPMFTVAGPPTNLAVSGDADIPLNGSAMFTVTATDMLGGIPHLTAGDNDKVTVSVQPTDALVTGVDSANQVTLGADGTATFTIFASLAADDGDSGRIIVQLGELQDILPITFSDPTQMPGDDVTAPMGVNARVLGNSVVVSWTPDSAQNADIIVAAVFSEDFTEVVALASFNPASSTGDPGTASFAGLASGTYNVVVAAARGSEDFVWMGEHEVVIR